MERTDAQIQRQSNRFRKKGKYAKVNSCRVCGKSAGINYFSHPETDVSLGDELIVLCGKCMKQLQNLKGEELWAKVREIKNKEKIQ